MELLGRHSPAPAEDIARRILVGGWWARGSPAMASSSKGEAEGGELLQLCRQRLDAFREQRGEEVFPHRSRQRTPISGSIKYRVLTRARGRCECCGAGCCLANPAPTGPGGAPHRAQEPRRHRRPQQPAGPRLPLQGRQARRLFADAGGRTGFRGQRTRYALREAGCVFFWLEGLRPGAGGERTGAVHRRRLSGDAWAQPGGHAVAWSGWVGAAPT
jgi:ATP adenylyltransferase